MSVCMHVYMYVYKLTFIVLYLMTLRLVKNKQTLDWLIVAITT